MKKQLQPEQACCQNAGPRREEACLTEPEEIHHPIHLLHRVMQGPLSDRLLAKRYSLMPLE